MREEGKVHIQTPKPYRHSVIFGSKFTYSLIIFYSFFFLFHTVRIDKTRRIYNSHPYTSLREMTHAINKYDLYPSPFLHSSSVIHVGR